MLTIKALYPFPSLIPLSTHIKHAIKINTYCFSLPLHKTPALEGFVMGGTRANWTAVGTILPSNRKYWLTFSLKRSPVMSKNKTRKIMIPPETIELETTEQHNAQCTCIDHFTLHINQSISYRKVHLWKFGLLVKTSRPPTKIPNEPPALIG